LKSRNSETSIKTSCNSRYRCFH